VLLLDGILWLTVAGATFSLGLMYLQFGLLHAFCPLCTASAATIVALLFTAIRARNVAASENAGFSLGGAISQGFFAVLPLLVFLLSTTASDSSPKGLWLADLSQAHRLGPADAPVQLVVYSDFQCDFCRQLAPVLHRLHAEFPHGVAVIFRNFPLDVHPRAFPAAIAAECAAEQGAFWEYHDKLFAEGGNLDDAHFVALAASLGLDQPRFTACLNSPKPRQQVEADLREAAALNIPGTPTAFLNGRRLDAPLTYERLLPKIQALLRNHPAAKGS
jgi:protein-disulfide isomerase